MAASPSPTVRRKRLGIELRRLRENARLTCEDVGQRLDCSGTRISRMETGRISVRPGDVRELLEVYGVLGDEADALVQLAREARRKGWWHTYGRVLPTWFEPYIGLEFEAATLRDFQCMVVPGLLQTKEYARAVLRTAPTAGPAEDIDRQVALRMDRQATLDQQEPPDLWVVLSENVLRAQVGGPDVMRTQLPAHRRGGAGQRDPAGSAIRRGRPGTAHQPVHYSGIPPGRRPRRGLPGAPYRQSFPGE